MSQFPFSDPKLTAERRIDDLLLRMRLDEKIICLGTRPDVPRLGVHGSPHIEGYHGVAQGGPVEMARECDVAIVCGGNHPEGNASWGVVTSPSEGKEAVDRQSLDLPVEQAELVRRIRAVNPNTVVVLICNLPYAIPWISENAGALLQITHCSQELGTALGDVLFGDVNPGGKLTQTWPRSLQQLPPMLDLQLRRRIRMRA